MRDFHNDLRANTARHSVQKFLLNIRLLTVLTLLFASSTAFARADFQVWVDQFATEWMKTTPSQSSRIEFLPPELQNQMDRQLTSFSAEAIESRALFAQQGLQQLAAFALIDLTAEQQLTARIIRFELSSVIENAKYAALKYPFEQMTGAHLMVVETLTRFHPIRHKADVDNYMARLRLVAPRIDEAIMWAETLQRQGHRMPRAITTAAITQLELFLAPPAAENILVSSLRERTKNLAGFAQKERAEQLRQAELLVQQAIRPAYQRAQQLLQQQLPQTNDQTGLAWRPDGPAAYAAALRTNTTTNLSAEEIHAIGLREVARIEQQMDALLRKIGYAEGSVVARVKALNQKLQPENTPTLRPELIARYQAIVDDAKVRAQTAFDLQPRAACVVQREPVVSEASAAARYTGPARDGSRPGIFWVPLPGPTFRMVGMRTLAYHEAIPGHHFQNALLVELDSLPAYRRAPVFGWQVAYGEGWALYAEQLAVELGWYQGDDIGLLGQLEAQLFRAKRLVADTGIHAMKWSRQQVIDYGIPPNEADRYVVWPGQATGYMIGMLRILELREKAKQALGPRFDLKQFHNAMLNSGRMPLDALDEVINAWIAKQLTTTKT
jgi:uncharacterized protein (DUF885 family)